METTVTTVTELKIFAAGVLAGAYRGRDISLRATLSHAVADRSFKIGRLARTEGEAFCDRSLDLVDLAVWEEGTAVTCPRCQNIMTRLTKAAK
jgi:hypothetical protein